MHDLGLRYDLIPKVNIIKQTFSNKNVLLAFSGGVDSTVLAHLAQVFSKRTICIYVRHFSTSTSELQNAKTIAASLDLEMTIIETIGEEEPEFFLNPPNRCYFCKKTIGKALVTFSQNLQSKEDNEDWLIVEGTNSSELKGHRPGKKALDELGIRSPLAEANLSKSEIRELARNFKLPNSEKPSMACLSTRVAYGIEITTDRLEKIAKAENYLTQRGFQIIRVRDHGNLVRIEVGKNEREKIFKLNIIDDVSDFFIQLGFTYVCLDLMGYRTGAMNEN